MIAPELDVHEEICSARNVPSSERCFSVASVTSLWLL
jgi:hypothetical protein